MLILVPVIFFGMLFFAFVGRGRNGLRQSFLYAATVYTLCLVFATEVLSIRSLLRFETLLAFWTGCAVLSTCCLWGSGDRSATRQTLHAAWAGCRTSRFALGAVGAILATILLIAVVAPPNNWDSMVYRMTRVVMWIQQGSVAHFPTPEVGQLHHPPLSAWNILHFQILSGGDRFANTVHWVALAGCGVLASLIAKELKQPFPVQVLATVVAVTLPMGLLQGSSSQGNLVVAFWLLAFVVFTLQYFEKPTGGGLLCAGCAFGFTLLSKGTAYAIAPPVAATLWLCGIVRTKGSSHRATLACTGGGVVLVALLVNGGHYARNWDLFGHPLGPTERQNRYFQLNEQGDPFVPIANLVRNAALHWGVPNETINDLTLDIVRHVFGDTIDSVPGSTLGKSLFEVGIPFSLLENYTGNFLHFWCLAVSLPGILLFRRRLQFNAWTGCFALAVVLGTIAFCGLLRWQQWNSRYHTPLFMLGAPLGAIFVARMVSMRRYPKKGPPECPHFVPPPSFPLHCTVDRRRSMIAGTFLVMSVPWVISNDVRPLYPLGIWQSHPTSSTPPIFSRSRTHMYFNWHSSMLWPDYTRGIDFLMAQHPKEVGIYVPGRAYVYPIWALLQDRPGTIPRFEYVGVTNASRKLRINSAPRFVILPARWLRRQFMRESLIDGTLYYPVYKSGGMKVLRRLWAARFDSSEKGLGGRARRITSAGFEPLIRSPLDVYLDRKQNSLVYVRDGCSPPAARLRDGGIPVVGRPFGARLARWVRAKGVSGRKPWQWERGNDMEGWVTISVPTDRRRADKYTSTAAALAEGRDGLHRRWADKYTPTAADVGYSLRASVEYIDNEGNQVKVTTEPSSPVLLDTAPPPDRPRTRPFFFLDIFPVDAGTLPSFNRRRGDFLGLEFTQGSGFRVLLDERCMAVRFPLPPFDIARIRTGESTDEGPLWEAEVSFNE